MKPLIMLCLALSGCATATQMGSPDTYLIACDGAGISISACYKKANAVCSGGYDVIGQDGHIVPMATATADYAYVGAYEKKSISVRCK